MKTISNKSILFIYIILTFACNSSTYKPKGLEKLTPEEILKRTRKGIRPSPNLIVKNQRGEIIPPDSISKIPNISEWTTDIYVNSEGVDVELVIRKATNKDLELRKEKKRIIEEEITLEQTKIADCGNISEILIEVAEIDQSMRNGRMPMDPAKDKQNLVKVISILEQCGITGLKRLSNKENSTIWLVIQHAEVKYQKMYLPVFKELALNNNLKKTSVAMMEDRILMSEKKPQIYGTQVIKDEKNKKWKLYQLANPETVNQRRLEIGFGPLEDYLKRWDIKFNSKNNN